MIMWMRFRVVIQMMLFHLTWCMLCKLVVISLDLLHFMIRWMLFGITIKLVLFHLSCWILFNLLWFLLTCCIICSYECDFVRWSKVCYFVWLVTFYATLLLFFWLLTFNDHYVARFQRISLADSWPGPVPSGTPVGSVGGPTIFMVDTQTTQHVVLSAEKVATKL